MDWLQRLELLVVDDNQREKIKLKLIDIGAENRAFLFDDVDGAVHASLLALIEPDASDKCTEFGGLRQDLPSGDPGSICKTPSATQTERIDKPNESQPGGSRTSPARTPASASSNAKQNQMQETPASDLHLDDHPISSEGWSGNVVGGTLNGRRVAVKLAPRDSERAEALLNEVDAYQKLQKYWGEFVPSLVGYGTTAKGQVVFLAIDLIDGSELGPGTVTEEVATAAVRALGAVHACKLLHGDVEARNIMVVRGTQPCVHLIDFGSARCSSNRKWQKAELRRLQRVIQDMMGVGVGKESGVGCPH